MFHCFVIRPAMLVPEEAEVPRLDVGREVTVSCEDPLWPIKAADRGFAALQERGFDFTEGDVLVVIRASDGAVFRYPVRFRTEVRKIAVGVR